jgi:hypothetical protein
MTLARDVGVMGPKGPLDWEQVVEAVLPMLLYGLVFVIGIQLLVSEWLERPPGPRSPDDPDPL